MKSKSKSDLESIYQRLHEVRLSEHELVRARAHLERAEAIAELLVVAAKAIARLVRRLVVRPLRRIAASVG